MIGRLLAAAGAGALVAAELAQVLRDVGQCLAERGELPDDEAGEAARSED